jgi:hypothetical protein
MVVVVGIIEKKKKTDRRGVDGSSKLVGIVARTSVIEDGDGTETR